MPNKQSQTEVDQYILNFLGGRTIATPQDLMIVRDLMFDNLKFRPYDPATQKHADSIQWKRTASEIIQDGYVYEGKACSDLTVVFLTLCKAAGIDGCLVKLISLDNKQTHSIAEVNLQGVWYRFDVSNKSSVPFEGALNMDSIWNKNYKVYKKGKDLWDLGFTGIESEAEFYKED